MAQLINNLSKAEPVKDIYDHYKIMPSLQLHMLRVAAVSKVICENATIELHTRHIISASLLHDMGNIIKFKLGLIPKFLKPQGLGYWNGVQEEFKAKYGRNEHLASLYIAKEVGASKRTLELIQAIGFTKAMDNFRHNDYSKKVCAYSDSRVSPSHILPLRERLEEGRKRYLKVHPLLPKDNVFSTMSNYLMEMEKQIFAKCTIKPSFLNNETVENEIGQLVEFKII